MHASHAYQRRDVMGHDSWKMGGGRVRARGGVDWLERHIAGPKRTDRDRKKEGKETGNVGLLR